MESLLQTIAREVEGKRVSFERVTGQEEVKEVLEEQVEDLLNEQVPKTKRAVRCSMRLERACHDLSVEKRTMEPAEAADASVRNAGVWDKVSSEDTGRSLCP